MQKLENSSHGSNGSERNGVETDSSPPPEASSEWSCGGPFGAEPEPRKPQGKRYLDVDYEPGPNDVICAWGRAPRKHPGYLRYRQLARSKAARYNAAANKAAKTTIVNEIIDGVREMSQCGGFVKKDPDTGRWYEVGDIVAREKVGQTLRDLLFSKYSSSTGAKRLKRRGISYPPPPEELKQQKIAALEMQYPLLPATLPAAWPVVHGHVPSQPIPPWLQNSAGLSLPPNGLRPGTTPYVTMHEFPVGASETLPGRSAADTAHLLLGFYPGQVGPPPATAVAPSAMNAMLLANGLGQPYNAPLSSVAHLKNPPLLSPLEASLLPPASNMSALAYSGIGQNFGGMR